MRYSIRRIGIGLTFTLSVVLIYIYLDYLTPNLFTVEKFRANDEYMKHLMHQVNYKYSGYDDFIARAGTISGSMNQRCELFLKDFIDHNPDWTFPIYGNGAYNKDIDKMTNYIQAETNRIMSKRRDKSNTVLSMGEKKELQEKFFQQCEATLKTDQGMADAIQILRVYLNCYFQDDVKYDEELFIKLTNKMFPYLRFIMPTFDILDNTKSVDETLTKPLRMNNGLPDYSTGDFNGQVITPEKDENLLKFFHRAQNGKGIVLSASSKHAKDITKLIRVLRSLNNELPIQIVFRGLLSERTRRMILNSAFEDLAGLKNSSTGLDVILPHIDLIQDAPKYGIFYPKQKISFMNVKQLITDNNYLSGYNNKLTALLFSSFREAILLDADTVPLQEITKFFETPEYRESHTMFFKDRSLRDTNDYLETNFFKKLMPMNDRVKSLDKVLDLPLVDQKVFEKNNFIRGFRHFQEAGVVVIDKHKHFKGLIMALPMAVWKEPIKTSVWGDKEFYWLGLLMSGDTDIAFNKYEAAGVGTASPDSHKVYAQGNTEVCSSHPGHVNSAGELMWINSGFSYCKKNNHYRDKDKYPFSKVSYDELFQLYQNPLKITHAVVPPSLPSMRSIKSNADNNVAKEVAFVASWKNREQDSDEIKDFGITKEFTAKLEYFPQKGWVKNGICTGYHYCAYDEMKAYSGTGTDKGTVFEFDEKSVERFDYLGKMWVTGNARVK